MKQLADAEIFVVRFAGEACNRSTPYMYISALPFCAKSSSVYENYWGHTRGVMDIKGGAMTEWPSAGLAVWRTDSQVLSVAFSLDGTRIVSGSHDRRIRVWNARSGDTIAEPFQGHTNSVWSLAFFQDGTVVVSHIGCVLSGRHPRHLWLGRSHDPSMRCTQWRHHCWTISRAHSFGHVGCVLSGWHPHRLWLRRSHDPSMGRMCSRIS